MANAVQRSDSPSGSLRFLLGILLGAAVTGFTVHYHHKLQSDSAVKADDPLTVTAKEGDRYNFDDMLRCGEVPVRLSPLELQAVAGKTRISQPPPATEEKPERLRQAKAAAEEPASAAALTQPTQPRQNEPPERISAKSAANAATKQAAFGVQIEVSGQLEEARALQRRLLSLGYMAFIRKTQPGDESIRLLQLGPFDKLRADAILKDLRQSDIASTLLLVDAE